MLNLGFESSVNDSSVILAWDTEKNQPSCSSNSDQFVTAFAPLFTIGHCGGMREQESEGICEKYVYWSP